MPTPWKSQPQFAAQLDLENPLCNGLASVLAPGSGLGLFDPRRGVVSTADSGVTYAGSKYGRVLRAGSGPDGFKPWAGGFEGGVSTTEYTLMIFCRINSLGTRRFVCADYNASGNQESIVVEQTVANTWRIYHVNTVPQTSGDFTGIAVTTGWHWVEVTFKIGISFNSYIDGALSVSDNASSILSARRSGQDYRVARPGAYTGLPFDGDIAFHCCWNRLLTDNQRAMVRDNPWQLFVPLRRPWERPAPKVVASSNKFRSRSIYGTRAGSRSAG